ncbi:MAG: hypothetical protein ACUVQ4_08640 [bacterium]
MILRVVVTVSVFVIAGVRVQVKWTQLSMVRLLIYQVSTVKLLRQLAM